MNLKTHQLRYFYWVARLGSYSRAAEHIGITEPSVYRAVRGLERVCGVALLHKEKGRLAPNHVGRALYEYAQRIDALQTEAEKTVAEIVAPQEGTLTLGTNSPFARMVAQCLVPWQLERLQQRVGIVVGLTSEVYSRLLAGELDVGFLPTVRLPAGLTATEHVFRDEVILVGPAGHRLSKRRAVSVAELSEEHFITTSPATVIRDMLIETFSEAGIPLQISFEADRSEMIADVIALGAGIGVLSRHIVAEGISSGRLSVINLLGFPRVLQCGFVFRQDVGLSPRAERLVSYLATCLSQHLQR